MTRTETIPQYFQKQVLKFAGLGLFLLCLVSIGISFVLARQQVADDLVKSGTAVVEAFHDRIMDGDIRSVEPQIKHLLQVGDGESAQILKKDLSRVYNSFSTAVKVKPCSRFGSVCFDGYFGQARIFVPISLAGGADSPEFYLYLSKNVRLNWGYLVTVFAVFALGYLGLVVTFLRISRVASDRLGEEIHQWSDRLAADPKSATCLAEPPFSELQPLRSALVGLNAQIERFEKTASDKARLLLLRGIAHDLLSPVARLQLYIGTLEGGIDKAEHQDTLQEIRDALNLVNGIASQVKTLNDLDAPAETTELIAAAQQEIRALRKSLAIESKALQIEFNSDHGTVLSPFSKTEIARILGNLVQNAADASTRGSTIRVGVTHSESGAVLTVTDHGCGVPENSRDRVFDPDFTLKPGSGTGLGLAIVKYICERRSAQIELHSQVDLGTTVAIKMPTLGGAYV